MSSSGLPSVSVVLAVRNERKRVRAAIQSVLDQTFDDFELIVVDDCSTDGTWDVICSFSDPRVVRMRNERRLGIAGATNRALTVAKGKYIAIMDGDDVALPERLQRQVDFLERNPNVDILGTGAVYVDAHGRELVRPLPPETHEEVLRRPLREIPIINPTAMMRRKVVRALGGYDPVYRRGQDYEFWLRARRQFRFHNLQEPLLVYLWRDEPKKWEGLFFWARAITGTIRRENLAPWTYIHLIPMAAHMVLGPLYPILVRRRFMRRSKRQKEGPRK